jgi:hypothetical protein
VEAEKLRRQRSTPSNNNKISYSGLPDSGSTVGAIVAGFRSRSVFELKEKRCFLESLLLACWFQLRGAVESRLLYPRRLGTRVTDEVHALSRWLVLEAGGRCQADNRAGCQLAALNVVCDQALVWRSASCCEEMKTHKQEGKR